MEIGKRIKERRELLKISQEELALKVGYKSRSSINKIEVDGRGLPLDKIELIAKALETTPAYLMGWDEESNILLNAKKALEALPKSAAKYAEQYNVSETAAWEFIVQREDIKDIEQAVKDAKLATYMENIGYTVKHLQFADTIKVSKDNEVADMRFAEFRAMYEDTKAIIDHQYSSALFRTKKIKEFLAKEKESKKTYTIAAHSDKPLTAKERADIIAWEKEMRKNIDK